LAAFAGAVQISDPLETSFDKERSHGRGPVRIDGAVALVMALELETGGSTSQVDDQREPFRR
jgi:hypothetical protein